MASIQVCVSCKDNENIKSVNTSWTGMVILAASLLTITFNPYSAKCF